MFSSHLLCVFVKFLTPNHILITGSKRFRRNRIRTDFVENIRILIKRKQIDLNLVPHKEGPFFVLCIPRIRVKFPKY